MSLTIDQFKKTLKDYQHNYQVDVTKATKHFNKCVNDLLHRLSDEDRRTVEKEISEANRKQTQYPEG